MNNLGEPPGSVTLAGNSQLTDPPPGAGPSSKRGSKAKALLAVGAGVLALLLIAGAAVLISRRQSGETAQPATTDQRSENMGLRLKWNRVPDRNKMFSSEPSQGVQAIAATAVGYIAVGIDNPAPDYDAAVWTSDDGVEWSWVKDDSKVLATSDPESMAGVVGYDGGAVAVGFEGHQHAADAAVWRTKNGQSWSRVSDSTGELGGSGEQTMADVADFGGRLVAVGREGSTDTGEPAAWYSDDGDSWRRADIETSRPARATSQEIKSVTAAADGLVAVGQTLVNGSYEASAWWSRDGKSWEAASSRAFSAKRTQAALAVASVENGFVAVGGAGEASDRLSAAVWFSPDGQKWESVGGSSESGFASDRSQVMQDVDIDGDLIVATGSAGDTDQTRAAVWTSRDGRDWVRVSDGPSDGSGEQRAFCVMVDSSMVVVGGIDGPLTRSDAAIWYASREPA